MPGASRKPVILVVEDDALVRTTIVMGLEDGGFAIVEAETGDKALELLFAGIAVDLVISDAIMPGTNGYSMVDRVRAQWPNLPIILTTGWPAELHDKPYPVRADVTYLSKPFDMDELLRPVRSMLARTCAGRRTVV